MNDLIACTIISKNYLSYARVFTSSFLEHHPDSKVFVLLVDQVDGFFDPSSEKFTLVTLDEIGIPNLESFCFKYNIVELNTAVKPFFLSYLFKKYGFNKLAYFDPDILIYRKLDKLAELLDNYAIVLIPHITDPIDDFENRPNEIYFLNAGTYNLGFIAVSRGNVTDAFLAWWEKRLSHLCLNRMERGFFVDQKWIDLVPGLFKNVFILTEPGYNLAYWNLHQRLITKNGENGWKINGNPLYFYHFSGYDPAQPNVFSKYQTRFTFQNQPLLKEIFDQYANLHFQSGYSEIKKWPYSYANFENGVRIPDFVRRLYHSFGDETKRFGNPFLTLASHSFFSWLNQSVKKHVSGGYLTNLHYEIYRSNPDLMRAFPDVFNKDFVRYAEWLVQTGQCIYQIQSDFFDSLKPLLKSDSLKPSMLGKAKALLKKRRSFPAFLKVEMRIKRLLGNSHFKGLEAFLKRKVFRVRHTSNSVYFNPPNINFSPTFTVREVGVNLISYLNSDLQANILALESAQIPYAISHADLRTSHKEKNIEDKPYDVNLISINANDLAEIDGMNKYLKNRYTIAWLAQEHSALSQQWVDRLNLFQEIWTFNSSIQRVLSSKVLIPVLMIGESLSSGKIGAEIRARLERIVELTKK